MAHDAAALKLATEVSDPADARLTALRVQHDREMALLDESKAGRALENAEEISDFERWYLSQPPAWIVETDALCRAPSRR